jgi:hypothetical protein
MNNADFSARLARFIDFFFSVTMGMALLQFAQSPFSQELLQAPTFSEVIPDIRL